MRIIGHQRQIEFLKRSVEQKLISHAYLFYGPKKVGKRTVALKFLENLNLENSKEFKIDPNLIIIEPEKDIISIERIRGLKKKLSLSPIKNGWKSAIIDDAHLLTPDAQSSLLKLLEEPKGRTVIILISPDPNLLLPTIVSRCQLVRFWLVPQKEIESHLKERKIGKERIKELLAFSPGRPGLVLEYLKDEKKDIFQRKIKKLISQMPGLPLGLRFQWAGKLAKDKRTLKQILEIWLNYFRERMLENIAKKKSRSLKETREILDLIQKIYFLVSTTNINPRLALEILLMKI
jgi:DNA polymerase-3 subunit delta'